MSQSTFKICWGLLVVGSLLAACTNRQAQQQAQQKAQEQQQRQAMLATAVQQHREELAACQAKFSESNRDAIARANCFNAADQKFAPTTAYPDLSDLIIAKRTELAERQAAGKITRAQSALEYNKFVTQVVSEQQRRILANNVAQAQTNANNSLAAAELLQRQP
jgi:hypothetical protein